MNANAYPIVLVDVLLAMLVSLILPIVVANTIMLRRMSRAMDAPSALAPRVGALEERMGQVERELHLMAAIPAQLREVKTLVQQTLTHQQERQDELEAQQIIDAESRAALASTLAAQQRTFADLSRVIGRLSCLVPDPVIPCPGEKA